jgi:large conductance mechanosensitive channel
VSVKGFLDFIRTQGVVGLAVGFILGGAVSSVVSSLVQDIINPILSVILGAAGNLSELVLNVGPVEIRWGSFVAILIDFLVIALVVYYGVKALKLDKLDKKKD